MPRVRVNPGRADWRAGAQIIVRRREDAVEQAAIGEVLRLRRIPAAEVLDRRHRQRREPFGEFLRHRLVARAVERLADDPLRRRRVEVLQIGGGNGARALLVDHAVHHRDRRLRQDADRGIDDFERIGAEFLPRQPGLVLPGQQHVTQFALHEAVGGAARAGIQHRHLAQQAGHEGLRRRLGRTRLALRERQGGEEIPARAARGLRVRRDHPHARLQQIGPVVDRLGVALAHQEHDRAGIGAGIVRQPLLPVRRQQAAPRQRVDIRRQRQGHDIRLQPVQHRARLRAGAAMRLVDGDRLAGLGLPGGGEGGIDRPVQLPRGIIGDVEQCGRRRRRTRGRQPPGPPSIAVRRVMDRDRSGKFHSFGSGIYRTRF